jgi:hypothetical protein
LQTIPSEALLDDAREQRLALSEYRLIQLAVA